MLTICLILSPYDLRAVLWRDYRGHKIMEADFFVQKEKNGCFRMNVLQTKEELLTG